MLFSVLLGVFITASFFVRMLFIKLKTLIGGKSASARAEGFNKYLIYSDDKRYWNSYRSILDEFESRGIEVAFWTSSEDDPVFTQDYRYVHPEFIGAGNKAFVKLNAARADVLLSTTPGLEVLQWKRSKAVKKYVHFFHSPATALGYGMFQLDFYDVILANSELQIAEVRMLEKKRELPPKEVSVVGLPYFDHLLEKKKNAEVPDKTNRVILLAPSWGQSSFLYKFGEKLIDGLVETGYEIVFRPHPQSFTADKELLEKIRAKYADCKNFVWNTDNDNFNILNRADLLISDFSDVVFDFALVFGKPIMYTPVDDFDGSLYDYVWANNLIWKFKVLPTIGCEISEDQIDDIKSRLDAVISSEEYEKGIKEAREFAWKNPGHAAEAIVDYLVDLQLRVGEPEEVRR
jgi:CDP-glycerol glycerophosphotransferase (TagB/SpsB family)